MHVIYKRGVVVHNERVPQLEMCRGPKVKITKASDSEEARFSYLGLYLTDAMHDLYWVECSDDADIWLVDNIRRQFMTELTKEGGN